MKKTLLFTIILLSMTAVISLTSCSKSDKAKTAEQLTPSSQTELTAEDEYSKLLENQKKVEEEAIANIEANFQPVDVNLTDPFEGL